jgi:DNA end-binding protein Ku
VRPLDGVLLMNTLHWPDEIRSTEDLEIPEDVKISTQEMKIAEMLVDTMATKFDPSEYKDDYKEAVEDIVKAKVEGEEIIEAPEEEAETTVADLMTALRASVERAKKEERTPKKAGRKATAEKSTAKKRKTA